MSAITGQGSWGWRKWFAVGATAAIGAAGLSHLLQPNQAPISFIMLPHPSHGNSSNFRCGTTPNPCWPTHQTNLQERVDELYGRGRVSVNPPIPKYSPVNILRGIRWVRTHSSQKLQKIASWILERITHTPHAEFERSLADSVDHLNRQIGNEDYAVLAIGKEKSGWWVTQLAMKYLKRLPAKIFLEPETKIKDPKFNVTYILDFCHKGEAVRSLIDSGVKHVVLFDDAVYSGQQMRENLECIYPKLLQKHKKGDFKIHVVVPFMTNHTKLWASEKLPRQIVIAPYKKMALAADGCSKKMAKKLIRFCLLASTRSISELMNWFQGVTTHYFDHKIGDAASVLCSDALIFGRMGNPHKVDRNAKHQRDKVPFIPEVVSPYTRST